VSFTELPIASPIRAALEARGYTEPTPVQVAVTDRALAGRDLLVSSRTGSGKTVAFGLVLADALLAGAETLPPAGAPAALVVAPTRELAVQVQRELSWLLGAAEGRVAACVGGMDARREARVLADGAHVVVGTPGRLLDHHRRGALDLSALAVLVLDEADEMLDMGFRDELEAILAAAAPDRRTLLFSATLPRPILDLAKRYTRDPARVAATAAEAHEDIAFRAHLVAPAERELAVVNILRDADPESALVFRATREAAHHAAASLAERGFATVALSGELTQSERLRALKALRDGRARVLVATDVAARGLDLPGIELVLHADLPRDPQALQHRSGRTGRAGRKGVAVLLATPAERFKLERMLREAKIAPVWSPVPSPERIRERDEERLAVQVDAAAADAGDDDRAAAVRLLAGRDPVAVATALVREVKGKLPAPEELPETAAASRQAPAAHAAGPRKPRAGVPQDVVWFKVTLGRDRNADPKWVLPLPCLRGGVTRDEIGKIVVGDSETFFQIARDAASRFATAARKPDPRAPGVRVMPSPAGPPGTPERAGRTTRTGEGAHERKPRAGAGHHERRKPRS
jgi:ATP-dependent RNA helicase DeaD